MLRQSRDFHLILRQEPTIIFAPPIPTHFNRLLSNGFGTVYTIPTPNPIKQPNIVPSTARYRAVHAPERNIENFGFSCSSIADTELSLNRCRCALACLFHLEQPCPARYAARLQGGRDGKADCLFRAASVRYHKVCRHGVKSMFQAFHRCVKRL